MLNHRIVRFCGDALNELTRESDADGFDIRIFFKKAIVEASALAEALSLSGKRDARADDGVNFGGIAKFAFWF